MKNILRKIFFSISPRYNILRVRYRRIGILGGSRSDYHTHKETARIIVHRKLETFNFHYNFVYNKVAIRNQRSRWGSCSKRGNLNFNYRIAHLPSHLQDYLIVHELCHLKMFNHSKQFWELVSQTVPDHAERRKELIVHGRKLHTTV